MQARVLWRKGTGFGGAGYLGLRTSQTLQEQRSTLKSTRGNGHWSLVGTVFATDQHGVWFLY